LSLAKGPLSGAILKPVLFLKIVLFNNKGKKDSHNLQENY
jgi:hypothetical protein